MSTAGWLQLVVLVALLLVTTRAVGAYIARVFGGGFQIAPRADLADGCLDAMAFGNMGFWARARVMQRLLSGTHASDPHLTTTLARSFRLRFDEPPTYETDGEWNRAKSSEVHVETLTKALDVLVPGP